MAESNILALTLVQMDIFFFKIDPANQYADLPKPDEYKSISRTIWNVISPFSGKLATTNNGVTVLQENDSCTITFNCYSNQINQNNTLEFGIVLNFNDNTVNFFYSSSNSQSDDFIDDVYIGISQGSGYISEFRYVSSTNNMVVWSGNAQVNTTNKFPANGTLITSITTVQLNETKVLPNAINGHTVETSLGGIFYFNDPDLHNIGNTTTATQVSYTTCNLNSDGSIFFGEYSDAEWNPLSTPYYKKLCPYVGQLKTTDNGITILRDIENGKCVITFSCYTSHNSTNVIEFAVTLYYGTSKVDYEYFTPYDTIQQNLQGNRGYQKTTGGFTGNYFIGYTNRGALACVQNVDTEENTNNLIPGASPITSDAVDGIIYWYDYPPTCIISDVLNKDLYSTNVSRYLPCIDDALFEGVPIGGTFRFGDEDFTTLGLTTNGFIYFTHVEYSPPNAIYSLPVSGKRILPFSGDFATTVKGINVYRLTHLKKTIIEYNVYSYYDSLLNPIKFEIILYHSDHPDRQNQYDFHYVSNVHNNEDADYYSTVYAFSDDEKKLIRITSANSSVPDVDMLNNYQQSDLIELTPKLFPKKGTMYAMNMLNNNVVPMESSVKLVDNGEFRSVGSLNVGDNIYYDDQRNLHGKLIAMNSRMLNLFYGAFCSDNTNPILNKKRYNIFFRTFLYRTVGPI